MKIKCTSKRGFKRILSTMIAKSKCKITKDYTFYAAEHFDCGVYSYKGIDVKFIPVGLWDFRIGHIYLAPNIYVQENDLDK